MIEVPLNTIAIITDHEHFNSSVDQILFPMQGQKRRDWFHKHAYFCLPLLIGNQMGIGIKSQATFEATWDGGPLKENVHVNVIEENFNEHGHKIQWIRSHFGMGTVTVQNRFHFRTPNGVNLMTINPPNHFIDGLQHMTGVIETDNLRRDFTFNLKLTRPGLTVRVNKGDLVGCVLPTPRYFVDSFTTVLGDSLFTPEQMLEERKTAEQFGIERATVDVGKPHGNGLRYFHGEDVHGTKFPDHQTKVKKP